MSDNEFVEVIAQPTDEQVTVSQTKVDVNQSELAEKDKEDGLVFENEEQTPNLPTNIQENSTNELETQSEHIEQPSESEKETIDDVEKNNANLELPQSQGHPNQFPGDNGDSTSRQIGNLGLYESDNSEELIPQDIEEELKQHSRHGSIQKPNHLISVEDSDVDNNGIPILTPVAQLQQQEEDQQVYHNDEHEIEEIKDNEELNLQTIICTSNKDHHDDCPVDQQSEDKVTNQNHDESTDIKLISDVVASDNGCQQAFPQPQQENEPQESDALPPEPSSIDWQQVQDFQQHVPVENNLDASEEQIEELDEFEDFEVAEPVVTLTQTNFQEQQIVPQPEHVVIQDHTPDQSISNQGVPYSERSTQAFSQFDLGNQDTNSQAVFSTQQNFGNFNDDDDDEFEGFEEAPQQQPDGVPVDEKQVQLEQHNNKQEEDDEFETFEEAESKPPNDAPQIQQNPQINPTQPEEAQFVFTITYCKNLSAKDYSYIAQLFTSLVTVQTIPKREELAPTKESIASRMHDYNATYIQQKRLQLQTKTNPQETWHQFLPRKQLMTQLNLKEIDLKTSQLSPRGLKTPGPNTMDQSARTGTHSSKNIFSFSDVTQQDPPTPVLVTQQSGPPSIEKFLQNLPDYSYLFQQRQIVS